MLNLVKKINIEIPQQVDVYITAGAPRAGTAGGQMASVVPSPLDREDLKIPFSAFPEYARKRLEMFDENHDGRLADCVLLILQNNFEYIFHCL